MNFFEKKPLQYCTYFMWNDRLLCLMQMFIFKPAFNWVLKYRKWLSTHEKLVHVGV